METPSQASEHPGAAMSKKRKSVGDEMQVNLLGVRLRIGGPAREIAHLRNSLFSRCNEPPGPKPNASIQFEIDCGTYRAWFVDKSSEPIYESDDRSDFFWWLDNELFRKSISSIFIKSFNENLKSIN